MNRILKFALALLAVHCAAGGAMAQEKLTLQQCRQMALDSNKQLQVSDQQRRQAQALKAHYKANFFPSIEAQGTALFSTAASTYGTGEARLPVFMGAEMAQPVGFAYLPAMDIDYNAHRVWQAGITVTQPIYMGGRIKAGYDISKMGVELSGWNRLKTEADVMLQSDEAYMMVVKTAQLRDVADAYSQLIDELMSNVEAARRAGFATKNDVIRVQVAQGECELARAQAENGYRLARMNLCHVIGLPLYTEIEIADTIAPSVSLADMASGYGIEGRPEYNMLQLQNRMAKRKADAARGEMLPEVGVLLNYGYLHGGTVMDRTIFDNSTAFSAIVSVKVPICNFGKSTAKARAAKAEYEIAMTTSQDLTEQMMLELTRNRDVLQEAILEVEISERNLEQAIENLRVSDKMFMAGTTTLSDHLEANVLWLEASQRLVEARYSAYLASVSYAKSCGRLATE